ncbi:MAG: putative lipid II flippase FtsW [Proteobacteria bacterium]|nr:putative lipid II flippase FtsW [Pseudomonadota bacterium]
MVERPWDGWLLLVVCVLIGLGVVMIYSASGITASWQFNDAMFFLKRQLIYVGIGFVMLIIGLKVDYRWYQRLVYPILIGTIGLLALVLVAGTEVNSARRWIRLASFNIQPAEIAKISIAFVLAYSMAKKHDKIKSFTIGVLPHLLLIGFIIGLLMLQPDFGSSVLITTLMGAMLFFAGTRLIYIITGIAICVVGGGFAITMADYRMARILAFLDPWGNQDTSAYQLVESLISIGSGGVPGRGLGEGLGKLGFVPELHTDFIGTAIAEELGFFGVALIIGLYVAFAFRGFLIAMRARDYFGRFTAFGLTFIISLQGAVNLCVISGLLPTKGLTLPFISFGGSSLLMCMFATGVLLNISKCAEDTYALRQAQIRAEKERSAWDKKRERILKEHQEDRI